MNYIFCICIRFGRTTNLKRCTRDIVAILNSPEIKVNKIATEAVVEIYKLEGDRIMDELMQCELSDAKFEQLIKCFEAVDDGTWSKSRVSRAFLTQ